MAYVVPIHRPNSVRHAVRARLFPDEDDCLVLAKANRLEIWKLEETGLVAFDSKIIHGTISMLQKLRPRDADTDILFVGTDRFQANRLIEEDKKGPAAPPLDFGFTSGR